MSQWHGLTAIERHELRQLLQTRGRLFRELGRILRDWRIEPGPSPFGGFQSPPGRFYLKAAKDLRQ
jgi:hypothetical protein